MSTLFSETAAEVRAVRRPLRTGPATRGRLPAPMPLSRPPYAPISYPLHTLTLFIVILQVVAAIEAGGKVNELDENKEVRW